MNCNLRKKLKTLYLTSLREERVEEQGDRADPGAADEGVEVEVETKKKYRLSARPH